MTDVLLIEDNPLDARAVQQELAEAGGSGGFVVTRVDHLDEGLQNLSERRFDAVLADLDLTDGDRLDDLPRLLGAATSTPVVVLVSAADQDLAIKVVRAGAQDCLVKGRPGVVRAISLAIERAAIKRALLESEERFRTTFEQAAVGIAHVAPDGRFLRVNDRLCEILGYSRKDLLQLTFSEITVSDDVAEGEDARQTLLSQGTSRHAMTKRYRRGDGQVVWVDLAITLLRDPAGVPTYFISVFEDVTPRKETEARARESEERYRALFDRSLNAVFLCDLEGRFLDANPAALDLFGYSREEIRTTSLASMVTSGEDLVRALGSIRELRTAGTLTKVSDYKLRRGDGEFVWAEVLSSLVHKDGKPIALQGVARDVTERRQAAAALAASEAQFRAIFEQAGVGVAIVNCDDGRIERCNEAAAKMFGYSADELCHMTVQDISHPDDYTRDWDLWHELMDGDQPRYQMEKRYLRKNGQWMWGLLTASLVRNEDGTPRFIIGMVEDISQRRRVEEALHGAKETLQTIFDAAPVAILALDLEGSITAWNAGATQMFGWTAEEAVGRPCPTVPDDGREKFKAMIDRVVQRGPETGGLYQHQKKDGKRLQVGLSAGPLRDDRGGTTGVMVVLEDVAERKQREQLRRVESLGQVTANIAHEFNNVLMGIQPFVELIRRTSTDARIQGFVARIEQSVVRGRKVTNEILRFTRGAEPVKKTIAVREWLEGFRSEAEALLEGKVRLVIEIAPEPFQILGDLAQLNQVLCNLIINARDASSPGGTVWIHSDGCRSELIATTQAPDCVQVTVRDEGTGIDDSVLPRIFDPLFTTKRGGTGLGLAICHQVVTAHGGIIFAESTSGRGTEIHIVLPTTTQAAEREVTARPSSNLPGRVLLVEDEEMVANGIRSMLEVEGVTTDVVHRGAEATDAILRFDPDVVLLDIGLPDVSGVDVCYEILSRWPSRRVIFMTGHFDKGDLDDLLRLPHVGLLQKPFSIADLLGMLSAVVDGSGVALASPG